MKQEVAELQTYRFQVDYPPPLIFYGDISMTPSFSDELRVRQMVERWAVWRDAGDWVRFATVWHPEGVMMATWFQGPFKEFIRVT